MASEDFYTPQLVDTISETHGFRVTTTQSRSMSQAGPVRMDNDTTHGRTDFSTGAKAGSGGNGEVIHLKKLVKTKDSCDAADANVVRVMRKMDILQRVFESMAGKDRIAKISKYVIDLLRIFIQRTSLVSQYSEVESYAKLFSQGTFSTVLRNPRAFLRLANMKSLRLFMERGALVSSQLGFYRQILRCGGTPFRLFNWYNKLMKTIQESQSYPSFHSKGSVWSKHWLNENTLSEFIDIYYGIMDELMLLYKLKLWSNKSMYSWVSKHEALSWYYDILLGLKKNWVKLQSIEQKEFELKIQYQVRQRALELSSKLNATPSIEVDKSLSKVKETMIQSFKQDNLDLEREMISKLKEFAFDKRIVKLDLSRLFFDFLADTTDVFSIKTPPGTYAVLSLCSGLIGFSKLWLQAKDELKKE